MALPKILHPTYTVTIPSIKKDVTMRPFTVQEEKILLMAKSSSNVDDTIKAVEQIVQNCITEPVDVKKLATFDLEYLFLKLRSKSVGETVELEYTDTDTNETTKFTVNLEDVKIKFTPGHTNKINVFNDIGIVFRYPTLEEIKLIEDNQGDEDSTLKVLVNCIDKVYDKESVYSEFTEKEMVDFIDSLPLESMSKIRSFFETMPVLEHTVTLKNKEGKNKTVVLRGLTSFFTF